MQKTRHGDGGGNTNQHGANNGRPTFWRRRRINGRALWAVLMDIRYKSRINPSNHRSIAYVCEMSWLICEKRFALCGALLFVRPPTTTHRVTRRPNDSCYLIWSIWDLQWSTCGASSWHTISRRRSRVLCCALHARQIKSPPRLRLSAYMRSRNNLICLIHGDEWIWRTILKFTHQLSARART